MGSGAGAIQQSEVRVLLFAGAREIAGPAVTLVAADVGEVRAVLSAQYGEGMARMLAISGVWVNGERAEDSRSLDGGDEVAVVPPVSGGLG